MCAGDGDAARLVDEGSEHLLALEHREAARQRGVDFGVLSLHRRGDDDQVGAVEMGGVVTDGDVDPARGQQVGGRGGLEVAAGDANAPRSEDLRNATHSDSADADEMNVLNVR